MRCGRLESVMDELNSATKLSGRVTASLTLGSPGIVPKATPCRPTIGPWCEEECVRVLPQVRPNVPRRAGV